MHESKRGMVKEGSYGYTSPEGIPIQVNYVADENGFRHAGVNIPADGKSVNPSTLFNGFNGGQPYDPRYNAFNPRYNAQNPYNYRNGVGPFGQYNPLTPFGARYPFDSRYNPYRKDPAAWAKNKKA